MLSGLRNAEKTPDKGWKGYPKLKETEEDSEEEDNDVLLLEDNGGKIISQGGNKQRVSKQVREPCEYVFAKEFKIPKKSPNNDHHSNKTSVNTQVQRKPIPPLRENQSRTGKARWFQSSFYNAGSTMKTRFTRNCSVRKMMRRQNVTFLSKVRQAGRNISNSNIKTSLERKNKERDNEPFEEEINRVMRTNKTTNRTSNNDYKSDKDTVMSSDTESSTYESNNSTHDEQETQSDASSVNPHDTALLKEESTADESSDQYFKNLYHNSLLEMSSVSEKEFSPEVTASSKKNGKKKSSQKHNSPQCKLLSFPSAAATTRNSLRECISTSDDDEKGKNSTTNSFYGTARQSRFSKIYGNKKNKKIGTKVVCDWIDEDDKKSNMSANDEDSPAANTKKRKVLHKKTAKEEANCEHANSGKIRKKHKPEPDFYLISSSDEEDIQSGLGENDSGSEATVPTKNSNKKNSKTSKTTAENEITVSGKKHNKSKLALNPFERDSFTTEIMLGPCVMLGKLRGSTDGALEITAHQLKWKMKYNNADDKPVEHVVLILADDITSFKIHVDNDPKIIVLSVNQRGALKLRGKITGLAKYFDPASPVVGETQILLQVDDTLTNEIQADISEWVEETLGKSCEGLSYMEAKELSQRFTSSSDPVSNCGKRKQTAHYNTRSSVVKTTGGRATVTPVKMIIYPRPPKHGGITVTSADVECLAEGQFLNDVIIDFYLKYIYHDKLGEDDQRRTHIFSSFFYKRLTQKSSSDNGFFVNHSERMHSQVKKWTRNVDIFSKDFIIVPINESAHWYLAIICFPHLVKPIIQDVSTAEESEESSAEDSVDSDQKAEVKQENNVNEKKDDTANEDDDDEEEEEDNDDDDDDEIENSTLAMGAKKETHSKQQTQKPKPKLKASPCILIFDSLGAGGRSRVFTNLRNYLSCEWKAKRPDKPSREFSKESFKGTFPKVPEQDNFCDCGIFVLQYVESFFEDPIQNYNIPIQQINWFTHDGISGKRQEIKALILRLKEEYKATS